ncbi:MAG: hypothetical protein JSU81_04570 [Candidatus Coatesbacteria bacterium]|nr:MAG: hypothetical protein JSU81_04570 [Candidatus Coatesbacteria bacterium]
MRAKRNCRTGGFRTAALAACTLAWGAVSVYGLPAFDGGTGVEFNAEDNATFGYEVNPAKLAYYERSTVLADFGGDWSLGSISYSENGGGVAPGEPPAPGASAVELKVNLAVGGSGLLVFRWGPTLLGFTGGATWDKISVGFSGVDVPYLGYFWEGEVYSFRVPAQRIGGIFAYDTPPWAFGFSGGYKLVSHVGEVEEDDVASAELGLSELDVVGGVFYRTNGTRFDAAGGAQILKNRLDLVDPYGPAAGGEATATRFVVRTGYRTLLWSTGAFGANVDARLTPGITFVDDGLANDVAEGSEFDIRLQPGFAVYPDEQTTLAFDYNVNFVRVNVDTLDQGGRVTGEHALSETWTSTQVGLERWFTEEISAKAGWRQNIFAYPRNTMFAGAFYRPNENWSLNYDYSEGVIAVDKLSAFMTLGDLVRLGGHKMTLTYSF